MQVRSHCMSDEVQASRPVGPVHRAFGLLQLVVAADEPVGVRDLARRSGLSRSTTGRMLGILTELGMVERTADGAAVPGAGLAGLTVVGGPIGAVMRERLRPLTVDLRVEFGENAALGVDDGSAFRYIDSARLDTAVQVAGSGRRAIRLPSRRARPRGDGRVAGRSAAFATSRRRWPPRPSTP